MDSLPLISIVIPVFNVELYLKKCVESVLSQSYKNLEIILVDDGSPDESGRICDEYALKDPRIKVIHKPNGGLSDARNAGMKIMTGEYVGFVDSDDWIEPHMYETLLKLLLHYDADMAFGGVADDVERNGTVTTVKTSDYGQEPFAEDKISAMARYFRGSWAAWDKLYRVELFDGIEYPVGEINEDEAIVLHLLDRCRRVCYTSDVFYHYMRREGTGTITTAAFSLRRLAWAKHCGDNLAYVRNKYPELTTLAAKRYRDSLMWLLSEMAMSEEDYSQESRAMRQALKKQKKMFGQISFDHRQDILRFWILVHMPFWVYRLLLKAKRR